MSPRNGILRKGRAPSLARYIGLLVIIVMAPLLAACQSAPQANAAVSRQALTPSPAAQPATSAPPAPPIVSAMGDDPPAFPSFSAPRPEDLVSATLPPSPTAQEAAPQQPHSESGLSVTPDGGEPGSQAQETIPLPTFTPPATPDQSSDDHFWFQRPVAAGGVVWTDKHYPYGSTRGGELRPHHGVEFNVPYNTPILAAGAGVVRVAGSDGEEIYGPHTGFYGNLVVIEHAFQYAGQPVFTLYGHLSEVRVIAGEEVTAQEVLGLSGATGIADGPHLHFEVRVGSNSYDSTRNPLLWLYPFPQHGVVAGRVVWPDGSLAEGAPVSLNRLDGAAPYNGSTTYSGGTVNPDGHWRENFALDDVIAGYYLVTVRADDERYTAETWVYPYRTSFVEITLQGD